jgi:hypothetical protein
LLVSQVENCLILSEYQQNLSTSFQKEDSPTHLTRYLNHEEF